MPRVERILWWVGAMLVLSAITVIALWMAWEGDDDEDDH